MERGEEYTSLQIDALAREDYIFTYKLTDDNDNPISDSIVWLHIGYMPKSKTQFLNERAIIDEYGVSPYFESLGTEELTSIGPGEGPNKMFGRPLTYQLNGTNAYGAYMWIYGVTDEYGQVDFEISFDHEYLKDFAEIFGSIEGISSIDDTVLYIRAFSTDFTWEDYIIHNPEQYVCSQDGLIFNGSTIIEDYDFTNLILQDSTYAEGIIRLHKKDIALGV